MLTFPLGINGFLVCCTSLDTSLTSSCCTVSYLNLPDSTQKRVRKYFETLWERHRTTDSKNIATFTSLVSQPLQKEITMALNRDIIKKVGDMPWGAGVLL